MTKARIILSSVDSSSAAGEIARDLVDRRLASCVNILPGVQSVYRWQGGIHNDKELLLIIKSSSDKSDSVIKRIVETHPYELPEVIVLEIASGNKPYLDWIMAETRDVN